jgi:sugar lactone lactonase YvrE
MAPCPARMRLALFLFPIFLAFALATSGCGDNIVGNAESVAALAGAAGGQGYFDGTGPLVRFSSPSGVAVVGTNLFIADTANHVIRKIDNATGTVSTLAGTAGKPGSTDNTVAMNVRFNSPAGITTDGTFLFVTDTGNDTIRKIVISSGATTTLAGSAGNPGATDNTVATNVRFDSPTGIAFDASSASLFVADTGNHTIRKVTLTGSTTTFAGTAGVSGFANGTGPAAQFTFPQGVAVIGTTVYIADTGNHVIRQAVEGGIEGVVTTLAGVPGSPGSGDTAPGPAQFNSPGGIATDGTDLFVADTGNNTVRRVTQSGVVTTPAGLAGNTGSGDGTGSAARFNAPKGVGTLFSGGSSVFYAADTGNAAIRRVTLAGVVTTIAGNPPRAGLINSTGESARFDAPAGVAVIGDDLFVSDTGNNMVRKVTASGMVTSFTGNVFHTPRGIVAVGTDLYVADSENHAIRKVTSAGVVTTFAGSDAGVEGFANGTGTAARFRMPKGIATDGSFLYVADTGNHAVRKVDVGSGAVTTVAGDGIPGLPTDTPSRFQSPEGIAFLGGNIYVADTGNHAVQKVTSAGVVTDFAGSGTGAAGYVDDTGTAARFRAPGGIVAVDSFLYVADTGNHAVRRISTSRKVTTFAGDPGAATTINGGPSAARMNAPTGIAGVPGTIYFTDTNENVLRKILF